VAGHRGLGTVFFSCFEVYTSFPLKGGARSYETDPSRAFKGLDLGTVLTWHMRVYHCMADIYVYFFF